MRVFTVNLAGQVVTWAKAPQKYLLYHSQILSRLGLTQGTPELWKDKLSFSKL